MTEAEFRSLYQRLRDELPWGADDRRGALNYITAAEVLGALGEITMGRGVSGAGEPGVRRRGGGLEPCGPGGSTGASRPAVGPHLGQAARGAPCHPLCGGGLSHADRTPDRAPSLGLER
jgi:hypothetical protein